MIFSPCSEVWLLRLSLIEALWSMGGLVFMSRERSVIWPESESNCFCLCSADKVPISHWEADWKIPRRNPKMQTRLLCRFPKIFPAPKSEKCFNLQGDKTWTNRGDRKRATPQYDPSSVRFREHQTVEINLVSLVLSWLPRTRIASLILKSTRVSYLGLDAYPPNNFWQAFLGPSLPYTTW